MQGQLQTPPPHHPAQLSVVETLPLLLLRRAQ
jgi:hypothetical protein